MDREAKARAIVEQAKRTRRPTPRWLWIAAIAVSLVCIGALAIGLVVGGGPRPSRRAHGELPEASAGGSGFGTGLLLGVGAGIAVGSAIALRRRDRE